MTYPLVWSERPELHGTRLRDCAYSTALMLLVYGGWTDFPLGIYTAAEREALERSDDQPDEQGASVRDITVAVKRRYGVSLTTPAAPLASELERTGYGFAVVGSMGNFPAGHTLRRHDPPFAGGHMACVIPIGWGSSLWLDPLAPNKYRGELVTNATVLQFAKGSADVRRVVHDWWAPKPPVITQAQLDAALAAQRKAEAAAAAATTARTQAEQALAAAGARIAAARAALEA